ncbi:hypothetical protein D3C87_1965910 [compost metagenome]
MLPWAPEEKVGWCHITTVFLSLWASRSAASQRYCSEPTAMFFLEASSVPASAELIE